MAKAKSKEPDVKATKKNLEPEAVAKRPAKTFSEILSKPKEQPKDAPIPKHPYPVVEPTIKQALPQPILRGIEDQPKTTPLQNVKIGGTIETSEPKPLSPYDFLKMPLALLDLENAGVLFKNPEAPNNKKMIEQYDRLLGLGYVPTLRTVADGYAYFQFEKK